MKFIKNVKVKRVALALMILLILYVGVGLDTRILKTEFIIDSHKIESQVNLAVITDLHSCDYGEEAIELMRVIHEISPDAILMVGDIVDDKLSIDHALEFFEAVSDKYPCYYVSGNHEIWTNEIDDIKDTISSYGITVLDGDFEELSVGSETITIAGIDDYAIGAFPWQDQLDKVSKLDSSNYTVFLTHRPYLEDVYQDDYYNKDVFDLVLAGHVHGGQWRFPGLIEATLGPDQGIFPEYSGGLYNLTNTQLIVSRGLAKESTRVFRFYNRPEVVSVILK